MPAGDRQVNNNVKLSMSRTLRSISRRTSPCGPQEGSYAMNRFAPRARRLLRFLSPAGLALSLAGCGIIIEIPIDPDGGSDTDTAMDTTGGETDALDDTGSSTTCDNDDCTTGEDSSSGEGSETSGSVPPPGDSFCDMTFLGAGGESMVQDSMELPNMGGITDLHVSVRVTHQQVGVLRITVEHEGLVVRLLDQPSGGDCMESHVDAIFDDDATVLADHSCSTDGSAIVDAVIPTELLTKFDTLEAGGVWTLTVEEMSETIEPSILTLESWCLAPEVE